MESKLKIAFEKSILKWNEIVYNDGVDMGSDNYSLCIHVLRQSNFSIMNGCDCPVDDVTDSRCTGTPYEPWKEYCRLHPVLSGSNVLDGYIVFDSYSQHLAYKELVFLENLYLETEEQS